MPSEPNAVNPPSILDIPMIRGIFEGEVEPLFRDDAWPVSLIVYGDPNAAEADPVPTTLGLLDREKELYFEVSFREDKIVACRKYTPDRFSHGTAVRRFRAAYEDLLSERLPREFKRRLFGLFLPGESGLDRHGGGFCIVSCNGEGHYHERCIEIENRYL